MPAEVDIAIVGTEGLLLESLLAEINEHSWLAGKLQLLGGEQSLGQVVEFGRQELVFDDLGQCDFSQTRIVISAGDTGADREWLERAQEAGCIILDIGARLFSESDLPPVVAGVNPQVLAACSHGGILTLPDAAITQMAVLLKPLIDGVGLAHVSIVSCQAVSDLGRSGVEEMARQSAQLLNGKPITPLLFPKQIAFNLLPVDDQSAAGQAVSTERRYIDALYRILGSRDVTLSLSCVWVPVFFGHSQVVHITTAKPTHVGELRDLLQGVSGIEVIDSSDISPTAVTEASGKDLMSVGRIRSDLENTTDFSLWTVADNLRFGIARNTVKIVEVLVKDFL